MSLSALDGFPLMSLLYFLCAIAMRRQIAAPLISQSVRSELSMRLCLASFLAGLDYIFVLHGSRPLIATLVSTNSENLSLNLSVLSFVLFPNLVHRET
jgi:hypothetical protein